MIKLEEEYYIYKGKKLSEPPKLNKYDIIIYEFWFKDKIGTNLEIKPFLVYDVWEEEDGKQGADVVYMTSKCDENYDMIFPGDCILEDWKKEGLNKKTLVRFSKETVSRVSDVEKAFKDKTITKCIGNLTEKDIERLKNYEKYRNVNRRDMKPINLNQVLDNRKKLKQQEEEKNKEINKETTETSDNKNVEINKDNNSETKKQSNKDVKTEVLNIVESYKKRVTEERVQEAYNYSTKSELSDKMNKYIQECIETLKSIGYDIYNNYDYLKRFPLIFKQENSHIHNLGTCYYPINGHTIITFNKHLEECSEEQIKSTIYHELAHAIAFQNDFDKYIYYDSFSGKCKYKDSRYNERLSHHGPVWRNIINDISVKTGIPISRLNSSEEWKEVTNDEYKYIFKCPNCGGTIRKARMTDFVRHYNDGSDNDPDWYCGRCYKKEGKKFKYERIK